MEVVLGLVIIAAGIWYLFFRKKDVTSDANKSGEADKITINVAAPVEETVNAIIPINVKTEENKPATQSNAVPGLILAKTEKVGSKPKKSSKSTKNTSKQKIEKPKTTKSKKPSMKVIK